MSQGTYRYENKRYSAPCDAPFLKINSTEDGLEPRLITTKEFHGIYGDEFEQVFSINGTLQDQLRDLGFLEEVLLDAVPIIDHDFSVDEQFNKGAHFMLISNRPELQTGVGLLKDINGIFKTYYPKRSVITFQHKDGFFEKIGAFGTCEGTTAETITWPHIHILIPPKRNYIYRNVHQTISDTIERFNSPIEEIGNDDMGNRPGYLFVVDGWGTAFKITRAGNVPSQLLRYAFAENIIGEEHLRSTLSNYKRTLSYVLGAGFEGTRNTLKTSMTQQLQFLEPLK